MQEILKLKTGARVRLLRDIYFDEKNNPAWGGQFGKIGGTIVSYISENNPIQVKWDNGEWNTYESTDLDLIFTDWDD